MLLKTVDDALDYLFSSFVVRAKLSVGCLDRDCRKPEIIVGLAGDLGVLPDPNRGCLISGSKGKGTTSRLLAWNMQAAGRRVGLILTPEETTHFDRIRIDNQPIPSADFLRIVRQLQPRLGKALAAAPASYYFPPTGLFLLIGLCWFKERGVDAWVVEGGRGVAYDEIGGLMARVGVLTSLLGEHLARLGPTLADLARDKLSLGRRVAILVVDEEAVALAHSLGLAEMPDNTVVPAAVGGGRHDFPNWYARLEALAHTAAGIMQEDLDWRPYCTPSYQFLRGGMAGAEILPGSVCCDGVIHPASIDAEFLAASGLKRGAVIIGLSDDKSAVAVADRLRQLGFQHIYGVCLTSPVEHISCAWLANKNDMPVLFDIDVVHGGLPTQAQQIDEIAARHGSVYAVGTQVFMRSLRQAFGIARVEPAFINAQ